MNWLVQKDIFEENEDRIAKSCGKFGGKAIFFADRLDAMKQVVLSKLKVYNINVFYGSLETSIDPWFCKSVLCNLPKLKCSYYYPKFDRYSLLNKDATFLPQQMLSDGIFDWFDSNVLFVRPDSGDKSFDGRLVGKVGFESQKWDILNSTKEGDWLLIAPYQRIGDEFRLVISDRVVTGSQYKAEGMALYGPMSKEVEEFGNKAVEGIDYQPDKLYTLDVGEVNGELKIIEANSFSCAGLYNCDFDKINEELGSFNG